MLESKFSCKELFWYYSGRSAGSGRVGPGRVGDYSDNRANSAQFQVKLPTGAELGNIPLPIEALRVWNFAQGGVEKIFLGIKRCNFDFLPQDMNIFKHQRGLNHNILNNCSAWSHWNRFTHPPAPHRHFNKFQGTQEVTTQYVNLVHENITRPIKSCSKFQSQIGAEHYSI